MADLNAISHERLCELLDYDPATGVFRWKVFRGRTAKPGYVAGSVHKRGYIHIELEGAQYKAHRLAWFYVHRKWPAAQIDHKNRIKDDNRILNLREATHGQNRVNSAPNKGREIKGVYRTPYGKWSVALTSRGRYMYLGTYATCEEAQRVFVTRWRELNGDFATGVEPCVITR